MEAWWQGLAPRERLLLTIAAVLSALVIVWQFMLVPTVKARDAARVRYTATSATLAGVQEAYMARYVSGKVSAASVAGPQTGLSGDAFKAALTTSATQKGLSISRLQGAENEAVSVLIEAADPRLVLFWLDDVVSRLGGRVLRLSLEQAGNAQVRLSVDLAGGGS